MKNLARWLPAILFLAPLAWLAPLALHPAAVAFQPGSQFSDLAVTHWPNALFISQTLRAWHTIPLWNPNILAGTPFAADPLSGLWYPPLWLAALFPGPLTFNLLLALHLGWAGLGMYRLAREHGLGAPASLAAGLAFGGMPKLVAHIASGHISLVMAVAWTGWLLLLAGRAATRLRVRDAAAAGLVLGLITLVDPRWVLPAALLGGAYALWRGGRALFARRGFGIVGIGILFAAGLSAGLTLPLLEFVKLSSRGALQPEELLALSLPPSYLVGLAIPQAGGYAELTVYAGLIVLALALIGLARSRGRWFWSGVFIVALLAAFGGYTPVYPAVARFVPGLNLLRVPSRFMLAAGIALAMLAAHGVEALLEPGPRFHSRLVRLFAAGLVATGVTVLLAQVALHLPPMIVRTGLMAALAGVVVALLGLAPPGRWWPAIVALACIALDLALYDATLVEARPVASVTARGEAAALVVAGGDSLYRAYSPSYSLAQPAAILHGVQTVDGVEPLQLASTVERVSAAAGTPPQGYSVTLPPFAGGNPAIDNQGALPSAELLGQLNAAYVVAEYPLEAPGLSAMGRAGDSYLYRNERVLPRAWVASSAAAWDAPIGARAVQVLRYSPNTLELRAEGPGLLVLSEAAYPGWRAAVDGHPAQMSTVAGWFRAIGLEAGVHTVRLDFVPSSLIAGVVITIFTLCAFAGVQRWAA
jgi:Bacterial membrane protein YfhO